MFVKRSTTYSLRGTIIVSFSYKTAYNSFWPSQSTKNLVYWPVYFPSTACTQEVYRMCTEVYWSCTVSLHTRIDRVYWPVYCSSTACTQEVYWVYTERVMNVYGFLTFQDWPRVLTRPRPCTQEMYWVYTERILKVHGFLTFQDWPRVMTRLLPVHGLYTRDVLVYTEYVLNVYACPIFQDWKSSSNFQIKLLMSSYLVAIWFVASYCTELSLVYCPLPLYPPPPR